MSGPACRAIVVRPEPGARATARLFAEAGFDTLAAPIFEAAAVPWDAPDPADFDALLVTSAQAFRIGGPGLARLRALPVLAVGAATADAARAAGFTVAVTGDEGIEALLARPEALRAKRLLRLAGTHRTPLPVGAPETAERILYDMRALPMPPELAEALRAPALVLLHSPRAARHFAALVRDARIARAPHALAAFSPAVAEAAGSGWKSVESAARPSDEALLAVARKLCKMGSARS